MFGLPRLHKRYAFLRDGEKTLTADERLIEAGREVCNYNKLLFGGPLRPHGFKAHENAVFTSYLRRVVVPVGRCMVLDRGRRERRQLYGWKAPSFVRCGEFANKSVESVSPWLAREINNCCTKEAMVCPATQLVYVGMLVVLPENDKDFKGHQKVNGGAMEVVDLYLDPRENKEDRPPRGVVWQLVRPPLFIVVRPLRDAGHGKVVIDLSTDAYAVGDYAPTDATPEFEIPAGCYLLISRRNVFNYKLKLPPAVAQEHGFKPNKEGEIVVSIYRRGFHMTQGLATTMHGLQGTNINDASAGLGTASTCLETGESSVTDPGALVVGGEGRKRRHSLVPTHLLWDPYGARDAGNYITTTRLNSPGGLTLMSELSVNDFCKRKIDQHLFAEEKELQEHAAKTKLTFSDAWLGNIAPKWAGARVPQRLGR